MKFLGLFSRNKNCERTVAVPSFVLYGDAIIFPVAESCLQRAQNYFRSRVTKAARLFALLALVSIFSPFAAPFTPVPEAKAATPWLSGWSYRKKITISSTFVGASDLANFPLYVKIAETSGAGNNIGAQALSTGYDIRFTSSDGTTNLAYERESFSVSSSNATANFWVKVPAISHSASTIIYIYYGNTSISTDWTATTSTLTDCTSITNAQCVWKEGTSQNYAGVYHLKEASSGTADAYIDSTANANHGTGGGGTPTKAPAQGTGVIGYGADFDGWDDYVRIKGTTLSNGWNSITMEGWAKGDTLDNYEGVLTHRGSVSTKMSSLNTTTTNDKAATYVGNGSSTGNAFGSTTRSTATWYHMVGTWTSAAAPIIYLNGANDTASSAAVTGPISQDDYWKIGWDDFAEDGTRNWDGLIDEIRLSSVVRSADWINFEYKNMSTATNEMSFGSAEYTVQTSTTWLAGWSYRKKLTISKTNVDATLSNFPLYVNITNDSDLSLARADGYDVRFTDNFGNLLAYERESWTGGGGTAVTANIWVKVPVISATSAPASTFVYAYFGNSSATSDWTATTGTGDCSAITQAQCVWKEGSSQSFKGVWHLPNGSSLTANDSIGVNNGTNSGAAATAAKVYGGAVFDSTDSINVGTDSSLNITGDISISAWVKLPSAAPEKFIFASFNSGSPWNGYAFDLENSNGLPYFWNGSSWYWANTRVDDNNWHYVTVTVTASATTFYKDGGLDIARAGGVPNSYTGAKVIGNGTVGGATTFLGSLDEVRVSAYPRSAAWIKFEYNNMLSTNNYEQSWGNMEYAQAATNTWLTGWAYRKKIVISKTNVDGTLANFPLLVKLTSDSDLAISRSDGYDVRFTDADGRSLLDYERESWTGGGGSAATANFWVRVPKINPSSAAASSYIYLYYGNSTITTDWTAQGSPTHAQNVWDSGYKGVWHLKETGANPQSTDSTGNGNNSSSQTWTPTTSGQVGGGGTFNGSSEKINYSNSSSVQISGSMTVSAWVKTSDNMGQILGKYDSGSSLAWIFCITNFASQKLFYDIGGAYRRIGTDIDDGTWHYVTGVYNSSAQTIDIYRDGVLSNGPLSGTVPASIPYYTTSNVMAGYDWSGNYFLSANLDEMRIASTPRSAAWIKFEYNNMNSSDNELGIGSQEGSSTPDVWLAGWQNRKKITISNTNVDSTLSNFPLYVKVNADADFSSALSTGYDIRFTDASGNALPYERESWTGGGGSAGTGNFWVKIPTVKNKFDSAGTFFYIYWGNSAASIDWTAATSTIANCTTITNTQCVWKEGSSQSFGGVWHLPNGVTLASPTLDSSSNANSGTINSTVATTGKVDGAADFTSTQISKTSNSTLQITTAGTIETWFYLDSLPTSGNTEALISKRDDNGYATIEYTLGIYNNSGTQSVYLQWSNGVNNAPSVTQAAAITTGTWYHLVWTINNGTWNAYLNSASIYSGGGYVNGAAGSNSLRFGKMSEAVPYAYLDGRLDEARISSVARSAAWIKFEYNNMNSSNQELTFGAKEGWKISTSTWLAGWTNRKKITISNTNVDSELANFPLYVKINADADFATAHASGYDVRFTDSDGNLLAYERESWTGGGGSAGTGNFWVKVPTIKDKNAGAGTIIYVYWNNTAATATDWTATTSTLTDCSGITNTQCVWKEGGTQSYKGVYHLKETGTGASGDYKDSTSNAYNSTNTANQPAVTTSGQIGSAQTFNGTKYIDTSLDWSSLGTVGTVSAWFKISDKTDLRTILAAKTVGGDYLYWNSSANTIVWNDASAEFGSSLNPTQDVWYYITATKNGAAGQVFVNGSSIGTGALSANAFASSVMQLGARQDSTLMLKGSLDEVRAANTLRSTAWIKFEYNNMNSSGQELTLGTLETSSYGSTQWLAGWNNRKKITIDRSNVDGSVALTNFPLLVKLSADSDFTSALSTGYDIRFTDSTGMLLPYERESWTGGAGSAATANFWVKVPTINYAANTSDTASTFIFMYYGNPSATTDWTTEGTPTNAQQVWDSNFKAVWHLKDATTSTVSDSTNNAYTGTKPAPGGNPAEQAAKVGNGQYFDGTTKGISVSNETNTSTFTISGWIKPDTSGSPPVRQNIILEDLTKEIDYIPSTRKISYYYSVADHANTTQLSANDWSYVTVVNNAGNVTFYLNGSADGTATSAPAMNAASMGYYSTVPNSYPLKGWLDEMRVSNSVRSAAWIKLEYQNMYASGNGVSVNTQENAATTATTWLAGWNNRKKITISRTNVDATLTNFPFLVRLSADADLAPARLDGYDVRFTDSTGTVLPYERESWSGGNGAAATANFWVKVPTINANTAATDTFIYIYFGNPSASTDWAAQGSPTNAQQVWDSNFKGVWHLKETGTNPTIYDSTSNGKNSTTQTWTPTTSGKVGSGGTFNGTSNYAQVSATDPLSNTAYTLSGWVKYASSGGVGVYRSMFFFGNSLYKLNYYHNTGYGDQPLFITGGGRYQYWAGASPVNLYDQGWHYVSLSISNEADSANWVLIVDGQTQDKETRPNPASSNTGSNVSRTLLQIGGNSTDGQYLKGDLDEIRISATNRSAAWIKFEYYNQKTDATSEQTADTLLTARNLPAMPLTQTAIQAPIHNRATSVTGWLAGWSYRKKITIKNTNVTGNLANFPLVVTFSNNADLANALATGYDVRFTSDDGSTTLDYERESWSGGGGSNATAVFWVKVPLVKSYANSVIYIYYGNAAAGNVSTTNTWNDGGSNYNKGIWHFASGSQADSSGYGNNGSTGAGTISAGTGKADGDAVFCSGCSNSSYSAVGSNSSLSIAGNLTIDTWIYPTINYASQGVFNAYNGGGYVFGLTLQSAGYLELWTGGSNAYRGINYTTSCGGTCFNAWHHISATNDGSYTRMYIDGTLVGSPIAQTAATAASADRHIGRGTNTGSGLYNSSHLDELRIAATARSAAWIKFEYNNMNSVDNELTIGSQTTSSTVLVPKLHFKASSSTPGTSPVLHWRRTGI